MSEHPIPTPAVGQIWREVDPRVKRYIKIVEVRGDKARIATCFLHSGNWKSLSSARWAKLTRFNGKRGGYEFVEAIDV